MLTCLHTHIKNVLNKVSSLGSEARLNLIEMGFFCIPVGVFSVLLKCCNIKTDQMPVEI